MGNQQDNLNQPCAGWELSLREALERKHDAGGLLREMYWACKITKWALFRSFSLLAITATLIASPRWWTHRTSFAGKSCVPFAFSAGIALLALTLAICFRAFRRALSPTARLLPYQIQLLGRLIALGVKCSDRMRNRLAEEVVNNHIGAGWVGQTLNDIGISRERTILSIRKRLGHKEWQVRRDCLVALTASNYRDEEVQADFAWLLADQCEEIRVAAVKGIGELGEPGEKTESTIRGGLGDPSEDVRIAAIRALHRVGFKSSETLMKLGQLAIEREPLVREAARQLLVTSGSHERLVVTMLVKLLADPSLGEANIKFAAEVLDAIGRSNAFVSDSLIRVLRHGTPEHRLGVSHALEFCEIRDVEVVKALAERLRDDDEKTCHRAVQTIIARAKTDERFLPILATQLECGRPSECALAGYAIVQIGTPYPRAVEVFRKWASSDDWERRRDGLIALSILTPMDEAVVTKICQCLLDSSDEVAATALELLQQMSGSHVFIARALTRMLADPRAKARRVALETIGKTLKLRIRSMITRICEIFNDSDESVRIAAIRAIADAGVKSGKIRESLLLKMADASEDVRQEAMAALEKLGLSGKQATPAALPLTRPKAPPPPSNAPTKDFVFEMR